MRLDHFSNLPGLSNSPYSTSGGKDAPRAQAKPGGAPSVDAKSDQVSLSSAGRALQDGAADAAAGEQALSDLTRQSLSVLGIVKPADLAGAKISFDSLTYQASSSTSLSHSHQSSQSANASTSLRSEQDSVEFHSRQDTAVAGKGHIQTADGREFEFEAALQVTSETSYEQSSNSAMVDSAGARPPPPGPAGQGQSGPADLLGAAARLLDQMRQSTIAPPPRPATAQLAHSPAVTSDPRKGDIAQYLKALDAKPAEGLDFAKLIADAKGLIDRLNSAKSPAEPVSA